MNTSKQVNVMIGGLLLSILLFGAYILNESNRQSEAREEVTERVAERGARLFVNNCRSCHGLEGLGPEEGGIAPALNAAHFLILDEDNEEGVEPTPQGEADAVDKFLSETISCGRQGTFMPMWGQVHGGSLSDTQIDQIVTMITEGRWDLVEEIGAELDAETGSTAEDILADPTGLSLTESNCGQYTAETAADIRSRDPFAAAPPAGEGTPAPGGTGTPGEGGDLVAQGRQLATANGCAGCHSTTGADGIGPTWQGLFGEQTQLADGTSVTADEAYLEESIVDPNAKIVEGFQPNLMPQTFGDSLSDEEIDALIAYIESLQ